AVEVLDGLPFPPELAMTGSYVEHPVTVAGQVLLGEREFSLRIFAVEQVQAVDAAGNAPLYIGEGVCLGLALIRLTGCIRVYRTLIRATRRRAAPIRTIRVSATISRITLRNSHRIAREPCFFPFDNVVRLIAEQREAADDNHNCQL